MSMGIVSACLPTLGPVTAVFLRKMGIKKTLFSSRGATNASASNFGNMNSSAGLTRDRTDTETVKSKKDIAGPFYRLSDDNVSGETATENVRADAELRPDHGYAYTVTSKPGKADGGGLVGDEIPLNGIRVHTDFKQSAN